MQSITETCVRFDAAHLPSTWFRRSLSYPCFLYLNNNSCRDSVDDMERKYTVAGSGVEGHVKALICVHRLTMVTYRLKATQEFYSDIGTYIA